MLCANMYLETAQNQQRQPAQWQAAHRSTAHGPQQAKRHGSQAAVESPWALADTRSITATVCQIALASTPPRAAAAPNETDVDDCPSPAGYGIATTGGPWAGRPPRMDATVSSTLD